MLKQECLPLPLAIEKLTGKTIYNTLLYHEHFPPPTAERNSLSAALAFKEDAKSLSFRVTNEVKLVWVIKW